MASTRTVLQALQRPITVLLFLCGVAIPLTLLWMTNSRESHPVDVEVANVLAHNNHERKPLDYSDSRDRSDVLRFEIQEMKQIKLSVQNELRQLEKERSDLYKNVETNKDSLARIKKQVTIAKSDLQQAKLKLAKAQRDENRGARGGFTPTVVNPAPIVLVNMPPREINDHVYAKLSPQISSFQSCSYEDCFDYSRCVLSKPFSIYVYNLQPNMNHFELKDSSLLDKISASLSDKHKITDDPISACVFLIIIGPLRTQISDLQQKLEALPYWGKDGTNHLVLDLSFGDYTQIDKRPSNRVIYAGIFSPWNNYDIILAPILKDGISHNYWKKLPRHLPAFRSTLLYFEGEVSGNTDSRYGVNGLWISANDFEAIKDAINTKSSDRVLVKTNCESYNTDDSSNIHAMRLGEWKLCGNLEHRTATLSQSTFSLILGSKTGVLGPATYSRLIEALQFGSIPVLLGVKALPFHSVIDWKRASVDIPSSRVGELHYILRSLQPNTILEYRRQGRFLWETYFSSTTSIVDTVFAILRYKAYYPPPSARDYTEAKPLLRFPSTFNHPASPVHQQNFSVYSTQFWNHPPGPFHMYPTTPFTSGPVSGSQYEGLSPDQVTRLPAHVIQAGGITGPLFQDYLLGNIPEEQFTVVILTYERNAVLMEAIQRLDDLDGLAKVVVVWNSPTPPTEDLNWPTIGAPVEVVSMERNSLNNRFLPLANIQTEAVLSLDDDVHLRHDEIQFAFRVWREARDQIVGFPGRFHAWDVRHSSWLYNSNYTCELSMVLTGAAFLHKYYLYLYSQWMPRAIRDIVDEYLNCEDIAMNFLVSHITRKPPLKVTSRWTFRCPGCPENLSSNNEHFSERHICMNRFVDVYGYMPLLYTQFRLDSVLFKTRLPSYLEKCYQFV